MEINTDSSSTSQHPQLPPGFRFHPTDEELVVHYLKKKASSSPLPVTIIVEIDLYKFDPWELPGKANFGDQEWYFFSPRDRKYPNGARPNRAATSGYWKATGTDKPILSSDGSQKVGVKKALVFYGGKPPKGVKTNWIMHEYRLVDNDTINKHPFINPAAKNTSLRLDDWVLCRIYKKNNSQRSVDKDDSMDDMLGSMQPTPSKFYFQRDLEPKLASKSITCDGSMLQNNEFLFDGFLSSSTNGINVGNFGHQPSSSSCYPSSSSLKPLFSSMLPTSTTESTHTHKRGLSSPYHWSEPGIISPQSAKKFHASPENDSSISGCNNILNDGCLSSTMETLFTQTPTQATPMHHHPLLGSLGDGDGFFRQPYHISGMNWNP